MRDAAARARGPRLAATSARANWGRPCVPCHLAHWSHGTVKSLLSPVKQGFKQIGMRRVHLALPRNTGDGDAFPRNANKRVRSQVSRYIWSQVKRVMRYTVRMSKYILYINNNCKLSD